MNTRVAFPVAARAERGPSVSTPPPSAVNARGHKAPTAAVNARGYNLPIRAALLFLGRLIFVVVVWSLSVLAACLLSGCGLFFQRRDWQMDRAEWQQLRDYVTAMKLIDGMEAPEKQ